MSDTLIERLEKLHQLTEVGREFNVDFGERKLSDVEVEIIRNFYRENPLAHDVAKRRDSYRARIEPIEEKYDSFWKRTLVPRKNELFDQEVWRVLGSMNNVGIASYIYPELFTTMGKIEHTFSEKRFLGNYLMIMGGVFGLAVGITYSFLPEFRDELFADTTLVNCIGISILASTFVLYGLGRMFENPNMERDLGNLRKNAQETDKFLQQHYLD